MTDELIRAAVWAMTSTAAIIVSFVYGQVQGTDPTTVLLGAGGLIGLVALLWRLANDWRQSSSLIDTYQEALKSEREENQILRDQIRRTKKDDA